MNNDSNYVGSHYRVDTKGVYIPLDSSAKTVNNMMWLFFLKLAISFYLMNDLVSININKG